MRLIKVQLIICLVLFIGCETYREILIPEVPSKLVVNGIFNADSVVQIYLSSSVFITENLLVSDIRVENAHILLYENDELIDELLFLTEQEYNISDWQNSRVPSLYRGQESNLFNAGQEYELLIEAEGFEAISAKTTVPSKIEIKNVSVDYNNRVTINQHHNGFETSIEIKNEPGENFYIIELYELVFFYDWDDIINQDVKYNYWGRTSIAEFPEQTSLPINEDYNSLYPWKSGILTSDELSTSESNIFKVLLPTHIVDGWDCCYEDESPDLEPEYYIGVKHITKEQYEYELSREKQIDNGGDIFSEPTIVPSNVENGLGIFAGYSLSMSDQLVLPEN